MRIVALWVMALLLVGTQGCSEDKQKQDQAQVEKAMVSHCQRIRSMSLEAYTQQYILHNGDTPEDRQAAKRDYLQCQSSVIKTAQAPH